MATLNKMTGFKVYKGTKDTFISTNKAEQYKDAIVFITGGTGNEKNSCIFAQGTYFANISELIKAINYVKGITVGGTSYNAAVGGGYVAFEASDPSTVAVNASSNGIAIGLTNEFVTKVNTTATNLGTASDSANESGSAFARIAALANAIGSEGSVSGQITNAINNLRTEIVGTLDTNDAKTLAAINDELNLIDAKWASYVSKAELETIEDTKESGTDVNVSVTTKGGKVTAVTVNEQGLINKLNLKANAADVYTKTDAETMAQGKVDALANGAVKDNTDAIAKLNGNTSIEGSVDKKIQDAINAFAGSADNDNVIENVTELLAYVSKVDGGKDLSVAIADIATNKAAIEALNGNADTEGSVAKAIAAEAARAEAAYAVKGTESVASGAAARADEAYNLAAGKATAAEAKAQAVTAISEITEASKSDSDNAYVKVTVKTKAGSVSEVSVDDAGVKSYADSVAGTAKSEAITAANSNTTEVLKGYYTKAEVDAMWMWEEL